MTDSQKFISRNRAPRVQIEYDVELYGSEKTVQLPFVMGVMSDLSGKSTIAQPPIAERDFLEIDVDNFDKRMKAMAPRVAFTVPDTLTGAGNLNVDLTFEAMSDFEPAAIAGKIAPLRALLEARTQLSNLMAYMDGKAGAEALIETILADPALLSALGASGSDEGAGSADLSAALSSLRAQHQPDAPRTDPSASILSDLATQAPPEVTPTDPTTDILSSLSANAPEDTPSEDPSAWALASLSAQAPDAPVEEDPTAGILSGLSANMPEDTPGEDPSASALASLSAQAPEAPVEEDPTADILSGLSDDALEVRPSEDLSASALASLSVQKPQATKEDDPAGDILADLSEFMPDAPAEVDTAEDILSGLSVDAPQAVPSEDPSVSALASLSAAAPKAVEDRDPTGDILSGLSTSAPEEVTPADDLDDLLSGLVGDPDDAGGEEDPSDDVLAGLAELGSDPAGADDRDEGVGNVLSGLADAGPPEDDAPTDPGLDNLLQDLAGSQDVAASAGPVTKAPVTLDDLASGMVAPPSEPPSGQNAAADALDDLLGGLEAAPTDEPAAEVAADGPGQADGLDDLLAGPAATPSDGGDDMSAPHAVEDASAGATSAAELADASVQSATGEDGHASEADPLGGLDDMPGAGAEGALDDLDALLDGLEPDLPPELDTDPTPAGAVEAEGGLADLDDLLADLDEGAATGGAQQKVEPQMAFGTLSAARPAPERLNRKRFRIALFGDFSGRAARGALETGAALAAREPVLLDPDTVEDIIAGFAGDLVLPVGKDGAGVKVPLKGLDDLHPDELFEKVDLFAELTGLRAQLQAGATSAGAMERLKTWAAIHDMALTPTRARSAATSVPADRKLSDFQMLIGDHGGQLSQPGPLDEMLARIVGPHVASAPDADAVAAVDAAISSAMRLILHHPDFQALESQWRSLDLLARSIAADDQLDVMLYDVSAEEIAADLAATEDLAETGLVRLLTEAPLDEETGRGGYSALIGLYTFEETPPHAQILGRIARVAAHVDAPFVAALSASTFDTARVDRHPLVAEAWDTLRAMPEAAHLGLAAPRFMLRRPYGARSEPIYEFDFEEFTMAEGLRGLLWANPVVLVTILLAQSFRKNGPGLDLGSVMALGDIPFHHVTDRYGDQVALPCTERNLTLARVEAVMARGVMPVLWIKGRDEIRLGSFNALGGETLRGPWTGTPVPPPSPPRPAVPARPAGAEKTGASVTKTTDSLDELDDLLSGFSDDAMAAPPASGGDGDIDAELAALLEDL
ncbi:MAG: type VI secretion system contractile sheath small subunit [Rhodobacteraceae bacterium]|nr:type VI secretion system contractile sheath small subunit [Paracoccaceae bacterium]